MTARSDDVWAGAPSRPTSIRNLRALIDRTVICWGRGGRAWDPFLASPEPWEPAWCLALSGQRMLDLHVRTEAF